MHSASIQTKELNQPSVAKQEVKNNLAGSELQLTLNQFSIQPKLTVGAPDDEYEKEADAKAAKVMRMPETNFIQRKCADCEKEEKEIQRKPITPFIQTKTENGNHTSDQLTSAINTSRGSGSSLDQPTKSFMESRFGNDFSSVNIHTGSDAVQMNRELNAHAFTTGSDIYFNEGQYQPQTDSGKQLLAHELTHVVQQSRMQQPMVAREEAEKNDADVSLGVLDNSYISKGAEEIVGHTQWIVLKEFLRGMLAGVKFMPVEQKHRIQKKFSDRGFYDTVKYASGYSLGIIEGIGSSIYGLVEAVITLFKLPFEISRFLYSTLPDLAVRYGPRIQAFLMDGDGIEQKMKNAVRKFMQNPRQNLNQIRSMLDAMGNLALAKVRQLGHGVAGKIVTFLEEPSWFEFGRDIGKVVGQILFEVILAVASDAIANVVKEALSVVGRLTARVVTGTMELIRSAGRLVGEALEWLGRIGSKVSGEMGEMFEGLRAFLTKLRGLIAELGAEGAVADTGIGGRMTIPDVKPPVLESRALKPPARTSPAKVSDLTPPKVHPSNVPKEVHVPKREPFAKDPDFAKGIADESKVPGAKTESLEDIQKGNKSVQERNAQGSGMFNIDKHHVFPQEKRSWFTKRGMKGANDIDNFTVKMDKALHQAQHGGGDWKLARKIWQDEYNKLVMRELKNAEKAKGALLNPEEIKNIVFNIMNDRKIPYEFVPYK